MSPEDANLSDAGIVLEQVRSEGLWQWNITMNVEYHYEIFNRLPVYYGRDLYDTEDTDEFDPDVQEIMDFLNCTHSHPDGGETRGVHTVDMVYMCRTVSGDKPGAQDEPDRSSETDASCMEDFDATGDNSDTDSVGELEYNTWNDACKNVDAGIHPPRFCLGQQHSLWDSVIRNDDSMIIDILYPKLTIYCHVADMDYPSPAVCYDCIYLMSLIWITTSLSYDGDGTVNRTGHDGGYDCSPVGILGCLPRCLCLPWVIDGMTQLLTKINGPYSDMLLRKTMHGGGRRGVCTSATPRHIPRWDFRSL